MPSFNTPVLSFSLGICYDCFKISICSFALALVDDGSLKILKIGFDANLLTCIIPIANWNWNSKKKLPSICGI
ncbi:hypothetical protein L1987_02908 [Smallanthus sonchifolius]|uniref:Uncharacterized protein n=1 Tax=Smallanthus sonchifolius TaxID=185202 RepID=A0ACB9K965_9ASTR|nr:hypothetical protein L1987_02908 [Smallanthus sonchifolius]